MNIDKNVASLRTFKKFLKLFLLEEKQDLWILIIYGICISLCSLVIPIAVQTFVNTIGFGLLLQPILILTLIVTTVLVFSGTLKALQIYVTEVLQQRLFAKVAMALALRIPRFEYSAIPKNRPFYEINHFLEVATLQKTATVLILEASTIVLQVIFGLLLLAFYHPFLLALNLVILVFIFVFFFGRVRKGIETSIQESKAKYDVASWLYEVSQYPLSFRSRQGRESVVERADQLTLKYVTKRREHFKVLFQQIIAAIILEVLVSSLLLGVGGWLVVRGQLTLGQLVASELIVSVVVLGVAKFGEYLESYYDLAAALDKIGHLLEIPIERVQSIPVEVSPHTTSFLTVKELSFENAHRVELASPISFQLNSGMKLALVGSHESVRSELIQVLYGLSEKYLGIVEIQGIDIRYSSLDRLREQIAYVKNASPWKGSVLDQLRLGNETISISRIQEILKSLEIYELFGALHQGLHTDFNEAEVLLRTSIRLKIWVARALLSQPQLILVDGGGDLSKEDLHWLAGLRKDQMNCSLIVASQKGEWVHSFDSVIDLEGN